MLHFFERNITFQALFISIYVKEINMLGSNNLSMFLMAVVPALVYSYLIYCCIPKNMVSINRARRYLVAGFLSPMLIFLFHFIFPDWGEPQGTTIFIAYFIYAFIQVGLLEEGSKYLTFQWVSTERHSEKQDLPIATMFYSMMISVGFAIVENILYIIRQRDDIIERFNKYINNGVTFNPFEVQQIISDSIMDVAITRAVSAVLMHMVCGLIMGYYLSKAKEEKYIVQLSRNTDSPFDYPHFKRWSFVGFGILTASIFHGMYDMNLMLPDNTWDRYFHLINIFIGSLIGSFIIRDMIGQSKELKKQPIKKIEQNETGG